MCRDLRIYGPTDISAYGLESLRIYGSEGLGVQRSRDRSAYGVSGSRNLRFEGPDRQKGLQGLRAEELMGSRDLGI